MKIYVALLLLTTMWAMTSVPARAQKDSARIKELLDKAYVFEVSEPRKALKIYQDAYQLSLKEKYELGAFKSMQYSGIVHNDIGNYDSALYYYQKSKPHSERMGYKRGQAQTFINIGNTYQFKGDYELAVSNYLSGLKIFETLKDSAALSQSYQNFSAIYATIKNPKLEVFYLKKAIQYSSPAQTAQIAELYGDVGLTLLRQNKPDEALINFNKTAKSAENSTDMHLQFIAKRNLGDYYSYIKQFNKAIGYYETANRIGEPTIIEKNDLMYILSGLYLEMKNYAKALDYTQQTIALARQIKAREILFKAYKRLAVIYDNTNQPAKAFKFLALSDNLKDSVMDENYLKQISLIQTQYETEKKDKSIAEQQSQIKKTEIELLKKENQTTISLIVILLLVILSFGIWLFFSQRQRRKNKEILSLKQQQEIAQLEALIDGEEKERRRIAQELHDGINGDLAAIKYRLSSLEDAGLVLDDQENLKKAIEMIDSSCTQIRSISHNLMPSSIVDFGLVETVREYCARINQSQALSLDFQYFGNPAVLPKKAETVIYRIIQELINNITRHAGATTAMVQMNFHENELFITVEDNGKGFDTLVVQKGLGLKNIRSRIEFLNAQLDITSTEKGTFFNITIDLNTLKDD
ncbi:histidine kinase [Pedobacter psychroterrae]|uniref:histidine kinase n=1 Tax=Pedobacter psychroterrae TaxID=2530453 RepID=A0A4R0NPK2_9SPHI|nr:histidine kinase [Pedobacter psychroterrae]TCD01653.1 hypothetical protein EZ437_13115 [Pedobacter psychroterrae]